MRYGAFRRVDRSARHAPALTRVAAAASRLASSRSRHQNIDFGDDGKPPARAALDGWRAATDAMPGRKSLTNLVEVIDPS